MIQQIRTFYIGVIMSIVIFCLSGFSLGKTNIFCLDENICFHIPETGYALYIDLDVYTMTVYQNGQVYKTFQVSGGANETPSPVGTWYVTEISDWGEGFGGSWIGLNVPWGNYGIHGTGKPWLVGKTNASHGCIRMKNKDVYEIRQLITVGTIVHIKHDAIPFRNMRKDVKGSDVLRVQTMLKHLGFYTGAIDGIFGSGMTYAVKGFQKTYNLPIDGVIRKGTYVKIAEQEKILRDSNKALLRMGY